MRSLLCMYFIHSLIDVEKHQRQKTGVRLLKELIVCLLQKLLTFNASNIYLLFLNRVLSQN